MPNTVNTTKMHAEPTLLSVISPVYQAEDCINELYSRLVTTLATIAANFEIILVEDCSSDKSWDIIEQLCHRDKRVKGIKLSRNFGQHCAITAGLDQAEGQWAVVMDCDLQDPPEKIIDLYQRAIQGYHIVEAKFINRKESWLNQIRSIIFWKLLSFLAGTKFDPQIGNFRIMSRQVIDSFCRYREQLRYLGGIIKLMGFKTSKISIVREARHQGKTSYTLRKLLSVAVDIIVAYSDKPLKASIYFGFIITVLSLLIGSIVIGLWLAGYTSLPGWTSVVLSIYFVGGIIIGNLGIIGIYLARTFNETKRRPLYLIAHAVNFSQINNDIYY